MSPREETLARKRAALDAAELFKEVDKRSRFAVGVPHRPASVPLDDLITDEKEGLVSCITYSSGDPAERVDTMLPG